MSGNTLKEATDDHLVSISGTQAPHAELLRRNTDALKEVKKSSDYYSDRMMALTFILLFVAFFQLIFTVFMLPLAVWLQIVIIISIFVEFFFIFRDIKKDLEK